METLFPDQYARNRAGATFTALGSLYYDSGVLGVVLGMFLVGLFFRFAWEYLLRVGTMPALAMASVLPVTMLAFVRASIPPAALYLLFMAGPILFSAWIAGRRPSPEPSNT